MGYVPTKAEAEAIYEMGREAVVYAILRLAKDRADLAEQLGKSTEPEICPSTPSGMIPPYKKEPGKKNPKTPGRKTGHEGACRKPSDKIDRTAEHTLEICPKCKNPLTGKVCRQRHRVIEDIKGTEVEAVDNIINGRYCNTCKEVVEPIVPDALPGSTLGNRVLVLSAWLHYGLGNTLSQIVAVFNHHLKLKVSPGGFVQMWYRLQEILYPWYEEIGRAAKSRGTLHADETSWRVNGATHWLWCFCTQVETYYMIAKTRGEEALNRFFTEMFKGTLVTDFYAPYNRVLTWARQKCLVHLFREIEKVDLRTRSPGWKKFRKLLKRLLQDALRLDKREDIGNEEFGARFVRLQNRLDDLIAKKWKDPDANRLANRLGRHRDEILLFLEVEGVPSNNNHGEREIRPAVIQRKNIFGNRSENGADMQAVLMTIYRTLQRRGHDPIRVVEIALRAYISTGKLPSLPQQSTEIG